ncbi:hypothetical protein HGM15179_009467 [Zosterops borbonicus]|uniref:Uncharacterized protein n=1 Tax=Zosterops borbonicus TaxID=364589 RepID=A0A8K1GHA3_9PASS|nr:hypothetical protein HGM15179_009467 [Zosterops borbonicus]
MSSAESPVGNTGSAAAESPVFAGIETHTWPESPNFAEIEALAGIEAHRGELLVKVLESVVEEMPKVLPPVNVAFTVLKMFIIEAESRAFSEGSWCEHSQDIVGYEAQLFVWFEARACVSDPHDMAGDADVAAAPPGASEVCGGHGQSGVAGDYEFCTIPLLVVVRRSVSQEEMENLLSMAGYSALSPFMCIQCLLKLPADPQHRQNGDIFHGLPCSESTLQQRD